ncbi:hypothetical protein WAK64_20090 [Bacillus spongiae]|uniref:Lipoprotein n=1 Tax=Bacillus spongiae TaxID=2683610 RepID=A0ABU8HJK7_9BACI
MSKNILWIILIMSLLSGCMGTPKTNVEIEWSDTIMWDGIKYNHMNKDENNVTEKELGEKLGEIKFSVVGSKEEDNSNYQLKDKEATKVAKGTEVYLLKGVKLKEKIVVNHKIYIAE